MLLYIHVPFCRKKCAYCAFASQEYISEPAEIYLQALEHEIKVRSREIEDKSITSLYLGGGTPTILPLSALSRILECVYRHLEPVPGCEFTIEANPEDIQDPTYLNVLKSMGINRVSLGVQCLDDELLFFLGRRHSAGQALQAAEMIREAGFFNLSLDFIWGLPGQTLKGWMETLRRGLQVGPQHVSCYGLSLEPGTRLMEMAEYQDLYFPGEKEMAKMYMYGGEYLESEGFLQYEISNFARMGYCCQHNLGYWSGNSFLGLGPSAVSTVNGIRWQNPPGVKDYQSQGDRVIQDLDREILSPDQKINEFVMLSLRTTKGLSLKEYRRLTGKNFCRKYHRVIQTLHKNALIRIANGYLRLTKNGMLVSDSIMDLFME